MDVRIVGVDFPPTRSMRQLANRQVEDALGEVARYIDKIEVFLVEFSADSSDSGALCSAAVFLHGDTPMLVEEAAADLSRAVFRCTTTLSTAVPERLRQRRPGPAGLSMLF